MTAVTNNGQISIGFPGGELLEPGQTANVADWENQSRRVMYRALIDSGVLTAQTPEVPPPKAATRKRK